MEPHLRPFEIGPLLTATLRVYRRGAVPYILTAAALTVPPLLWSQQLGGKLARQEIPDLREFLGVYGTSLIGQSLTVALIAWSAYEMMCGRRPAPGDYAAVAVTRLLPMLAVAVVRMLLVLAGAVMCVVPGVVAVVLTYVAMPAVMVERPGVIGAVGRSWELTEGYRWPIFGIIAIFWFIEVAIGAPLQFMIAFNGPGPVTTAILAVEVVLLAPVKAAACGVVYHQLRSVKEFSDVDSIAEVFT